MRVTRPQDARRISRSPPCAGFLLSTPRLAHTPNKRIPSQGQITGAPIRFAPSADDGDGIAAFPAM